MKNERLQAARLQRGWSQKRVGMEIGTSKEMISRWEGGVRMPNLYYQEQLCKLFGQSAEDLGFFTQKEPEVFPQLAHLQADEQLAIFARGISACRDLYYGGFPHQMEAILPLYVRQTALLAGQSGPLQKTALQLASQAFQLSCEISTDREDFGMARRFGQQSLEYAQGAEDPGLQVAALISIANLGWHLSSTQPAFVRSHSNAALQSYKQAISLFDQSVSPLLKGRTYAGLAEVHALRLEKQESLTTLGQAYEIYPREPEADPAYDYMRSSRYALYVFGDCQSRLLMGQPDEAEQALIVMENETNDTEKEPVTNLDSLYYRGEIQFQRNELEEGTIILREAGELAKSLGSRLYFNKLASRFISATEQWPHEPRVHALEEVFRPW